MVKLQHHILQRTADSTARNLGEDLIKTNYLVCLHLNEAEKSWVSAVGEASREKHTIVHISDLFVPEGILQAQANSKASQAALTGYYGALGGSC